MTFIRVEPPTYRYDEVMTVTLREGDSVTVDVPSRKLVIKEDGTKTWSTLLVKRYTVKLIEIMPPLPFQSPYARFEITVSDGTSTQITLREYEREGFFKRIKLELKKLERDYVEVTIYRAEPTDYQIGSQIVSPLESTVVEEDPVLFGTVSLFVDSEGNIKTTCTLSKGQEADSTAHGRKIIIRYIGQVGRSIETIRGIYNMYDYIKLYITDNMGTTKEFVITIQYTVYKTAQGTYRAVRRTNIWDISETDYIIEITSTGIDNYEATDINNFPKDYWLSIGLQLKKLTSPKPTPAIVLLAPPHYPWEEVTKYPVPTLFSLCIAVYNKYKCPAVGDYGNVYFAWNGSTRIELPKLFSIQACYAVGRSEEHDFLTSSPATNLVELEDKYVVLYSSMNKAVYKQLEFTFTPNENTSYFPHNGTTLRRNFLSSTLSDNPERVLLYILYTLDPSAFATAKVNWTVTTFTYMSSKNQGPIYDALSYPEGNSNLRYNDGDLVEVRKSTIIDVVPIIWNNLVTPEQVPNWQIAFSAHLQKRTIIAGGGKQLDEVPQAVSQIYVTVGNRFIEKDIVSLLLTVEVSGSAKILSYNPETGETVEYDKISFMYPLDEPVRYGDLKTVALPVYVKPISPGTGKIKIYGYVIYSDDTGYITYTELNLDVEEATPTLNINLSKDDLPICTTITGNIEITNNGGSYIRSPKITLSISGPAKIVYNENLVQEATIALAPIAPGDSTTVPVAIVWDGETTDLPATATLTVKLDYTYESGAIGSVTATKDIEVKPSPYVVVELEKISDFTKCGDPAVVRYKITNKGVQTANNVVLEVHLYLPELGRFIKIDELSIAGLDPNMSFERRLELPFQGFYRHVVNVAVKYDEMISLVNNGYDVRDYMRTVTVEPPSSILDVIHDPDIASSHELNSIEFIYRNMEGNTATITLPDGVNVVNITTTPQASVSQTDNTISIEWTEPNKERSVRIDYYYKFASEDEGYKVLEFTTSFDSETCSYRIPVYRSSAFPVGEIVFKVDPPIAQTDQEITVNMQIRLHSTMETYIIGAIAHVIVPPELTVTDPGDFTANSVTDPATGETYTLLEKTDFRIKPNETYTLTFKVSSSTEGYYELYGTLLVKIPFIERGDEIDNPQSTLIRTMQYFNYGVVVVKNPELNVKIACTETRTFKDKHPAGEEITTLYDFDVFNLQCFCYNFSDKPILKTYVEVDVPDGLIVETPDGYQFVGPTTCKFYIGDLAPYGYQGFEKRFTLGVMTNGKETEATLTVKLKGVTPDGTDIETSWSKTYTIVKSNVVFRITPYIPYDPSMLESFSTRELPCNLPVIGAIGIINEGDAIANNVTVKIYLPKEAKLLLAHKLDLREIMKPVENIYETEAGEKVIEARFNRIPCDLLRQDLTEPRVVFLFTWSKPEEVKYTTKYIRVEVTSDEASTTVDIPLHIRGYAKKPTLPYEAIAYYPKKLRHYYDLKFVRTYVGSFHFLWNWWDPYTGGGWIYGMPKYTKYPQVRFGFEQEEYMDLTSNIGVIPRQDSVPTGLEDNDYFAPGA